MPVYANPCDISNLDGGGTPYVPPAPPVPPDPPVPPSILLTDTFTGSGDITLHEPDFKESFVSAWTQVLASFQLESGKAVASLGANGTDHLNVVDLGFADIEGEATFTTHVDNVGYEGGFILRFTDSNNYLKLVLNSSTYNLYLFEVSGGVATEVQTLPISWTRGDALIVRFRLEGYQIQFGVGSNPDYWMTWFSTLNNTATKFGIFGERRDTGSTKVDTLQFRATNPFVYTEPRVQINAGYSAYKQNGVQAVDNETVYFMGDESGNRSGVSQVNANFLPTFKTNILNGTDSVIYATESPKDSIRGGGFQVSTSTGGITLFIHYRPVTQAFTSAHSDPIRVHKYDTPDGDRLMLAHYPVNRKLQLRYYAQGSLRYTVTSNVTDDDAFHIISWSVNFSTGNHILRADKATISTKSGQLPFASGNLAFSFPYKDYPCGGYYREVRLYASALDATQMLAVENIMVP